MAAALRCVVNKALLQRSQAPLSSSLRRFSSSNGSSPATAAGSPYVTSEQLAKVAEENRQFVVRVFKACGVATVAAQATVIAGHAFFDGRSEKERKKKLAAEEEARPRNDALFPSISSYPSSLCQCALCTYLPAE